MKKTLPGSKETRYLLVLCLTTVLFLSTDAQPKGTYTPAEIKEKAGIVFAENSWDGAVQKAAATHKYIFVDAFASWCGPCKALKATTFRDKEAAAFFNEHFINLSVDMEKGEGPDLAVKWEVQAYPTLLILDTAGKPVLGSVGFLEPQDLIKFGKQALERKQH